MTKQNKRKKTLKAYYKDGQNQYSSSTKGQTLLPLSSMCSKAIVLYLLEICSIHTSKTGSAIWHFTILESFPATHLHALSVLTQKVWRWDVSYFQSFPHIFQFCVYCRILKLGRGGGLFIFLLLPCVTIGKKSPACLSSLHFSMSLTLALFLCIQIRIGHQLKICRQHKATDSIHLGPSTSSFCVVFCIW